MEEFTQPHNSDDPDPWLALALDNSTFIEQKAKDALLRNNASRSRQFLLPLIRPLARLSIVLVQLVRLLIPNRWTSSRALHGIICWGMRNFVSKDANYLIFRHFHIGSQILQFLNTNLANGTLPSHPLQPKKINDFANHTFVQHDLNIYNFIINVNTYLHAEGQDIRAVDPSQVNYDAIRDFDADIERLPDRWHNVLDLQSAIELYTPLFGIFLSDRDFWRASNSLQLDETIAVYVATLFGEGLVVGMVNNRHPMVPLATLEAGFRLMLHGLDAENLYGFIRHMHAQSTNA